MVSGEALSLLLLPQGAITLNGMLLRHQKELRAAGVSLREGEQFFLQKLTPHGMDALIPNSVGTREGERNGGEMRTCSHCVLPILEFGSVDARGMHTE